MTDYRVSPQYYPLNTGTLQINSVDCLKKVQLSCEEGSFNLYFPWPNVKLYNKTLFKTMVITMVIKCTNKSGVKFTHSLNPITNVRVRPTFAKSIKRLKRFLAKIYC